jgi:hypothetical protein
VDAPRDQEFNGGRWEVYGATFTASGIAALDQDGNGHIDDEITSYAELQQHVGAGHVVLGNNVVTRFVCPLNPLPRS